MRTPVAVAALAALLAACEPSAGDPAAPPAPGPAAPAPAEGPGAAAGWRDIASSEDASRLGRLDQAWRMARAEADRAFAAEVEALGPLVDPNAGQTGRLQPPPGSYRCRSVKLGATQPGGSGYLEQPYAGCTIELTPGGDLVLTRTTGPQRARGLLYPDTDRRLVFIGARAGGSEEAGAPAYGQRPERDQIGVFERIGSDRWRLVLPWPKQESKLEILELVR
jgi:hypothetical protein